MRISINYLYKYSFYRLHFFTQLLIPTRYHVSREERNLVKFVYTADSKSNLSAKDYRFFQFHGVVQHDSYNPVGHRRRRLEE